MIAAGICAKIDLPRSNQTISLVLVTGQESR